MNDFFEELKNKFKVDKNMSFEDFGNMLKDALSTEEKAEETYNSMKDREQSKWTLEEAYNKLDESSESKDIKEVVSRDIDFSKVADVLMTCLKTRQVFYGAISDRIIEVANLFNVPVENVTGYYAKFKATGDVDNKFAEDLCAGVRNSDKILKGYTKLSDCGFNIYTTITNKIEEKEGEKAMTEEEIKKIVKQAVEEEFENIRKLAESTTTIITDIQQRIENLCKEEDTCDCDCDCDACEEDEPPYTVDARVSDDAVRFIMLGTILCHSQDELEDKLLAKFNIDEDSLTAILGSAAGDTSEITYHLPKDVVEKCASAWNRMKDRMYID